MDVYEELVGSGGGQGGCVRKNEVIVKMQKKNVGGVQSGGIRLGGGVRVDVYEELKLF